MLHYWFPAQEGSYSQGCMKDYTSAPLHNQLNRTLKSTRSCKLITGLDLRPELRERWGQVGIWGRQARWYGQMEINKISNRRGQIAIDLQWKNRLINRPPCRHVLTGCSGNWSFIKSKKSFFFRRDREGKMCWREFSEGRGCPLLLLLLGSGFMPLLLLSAGEFIYERRLIEGKLCVCVYPCWWISRFVHIHCACVRLWVCMWSGRTD